MANSSSTNKTDNNSPVRNRSGHPDVLVAVFRFGQHLHVPSADLGQYLEDGWKRIAAGKGVRNG